MLTVSSNASKYPYGLDIEHRAHAFLLMLERRIERIASLERLFPIGYVLGRFLLNCQEYDLWIIKVKPPSTRPMRPVAIN